MLSLLFKREELPFRLNGNGKSLPLQMKRIERKLVRNLISVLVVGLLSAPAMAQSYPTKPIRLIVAFAPGGASDLLARMLAQRLSESFGQSVIVDNRPAAGGIIGSEVVARATPDGYTLLVGSAAAFAITPHLNVKLPYDTVKDFVPVSPYASLTFVLVINPKVPAPSLKELIALAKTKPGTLNLGSAGNGTTTHMVGELFKYTAGINLTHVPYKGAGPAMVALVSGETEVLFDAAITTLPQIKAGRIRALAVGSPKRSTLFPDVPTMSEAGLPGFHAGNWFGLFAPARSPTYIITRINAEVAKVMEHPDARQDLVRNGAEPLTLSPDAFRGLVASEYERYGKLVKLSGIKIN
jgi:tripartite-type tricarboxylate transporter receptor subunit TctC